MVRIVTDYNEKLKTRWLYEQAFDDPERFVDYYYSEKCSDNVMVVKEDDDGHILSMLHLNPFFLNVMGERILSYYVVAVATDERRRHEGHMGDVLCTSFEWLKKEMVPFVFLLPVDEAIYTGFGFGTVCRFILRDYRLTYETVRNDYDIYCIRDERYLRRAALEDMLYDEGACEVLPAEPVIMVKVTDPDSFRALPGASGLENEAEMLDYLRDKKLYFTEEV